MITSSPSARNVRVSPLGNSIGLRGRGFQLPINVYKLLGLVFRKSLEISLLRFHCCQRFTRCLKLLSERCNLRFQGDLYSPMEKDGIFMQPNPDDHEHLWVLLNKLNDAEQLNDALLDGLRRDDIWHGDDAPGPSTYIAAPVSIPEQRRAPFKEFNDLDKQGAWMKNFTSKEAESLPSMMVLTKKRRKNEHGI
jgi:hypothetical protein